ncbi:hypothetical protein GWK47_024363 [Chionoecetes opilio]|uniref:Uncharacterized protein n=1 Tax=Chionoecetes opilio TaxID=41210 RepID=A0A8J4XPV5_CHIOP|nr:hypothetical protein GWK47_024363 [Chionoecetes opilio]
MHRREAPFLETSGRGAGHCFQVVGDHVTLPKRIGHRAMRSRGRPVDCRVIGSIAVNVPSAKGKCWSPCVKIFKCVPSKQLRENQTQRFLVESPTEKCRPFMSKGEKMDGKLAE